MFKLIKILDKLIKNFRFFRKNKLIYQNESEAAHPVYIYDNCFFRSLNFGNTATQSRVCKIAKHTPALTSVRILSLAGELYIKLFQSEFHKFHNKVLILGLGGGDLVRYYDKLSIQFNSSFEITTVEHSKEIIKIAKNYFYLDNLSSKINIIAGDAYDYILKNNNKIYQIINVDFFTELDSALRILKDEYFSSLYNKLDPNKGILAINLLISQHENLLKLLRILKTYFGKNILINESHTHYNIIILAFRNNGYIEYLSQLNNHAIPEYIDNIKFSSHIGCFTALFSNT